MLTKKLTVTILIIIVGLGTALSSILWILHQLILFNFYGYVLIGEPNKTILYCEIGLFCFGLLCFFKVIYDAIRRL